MKFKFLGTEIYISFLFVAVVSFILATDRTGYCLPTLFSVIIHETGHLFAMWICDCQPKTIRLVPASVCITRGFSSKKGGEGFIAAAGPVVNIFLFGSLFINYKLTGSGISLQTALISLLVGLFNLLPVCGLDGGFLLKLFLDKFFNARKSLLIVKMITLVLALAFGILGITLIMKGGKNLSFLILGVYLLLSALIKQ